MAERSEMLVDWLQGLGLPSGVPSSGYDEPYVTIYESLVDDTKPNNDILAKVRKQLIEVLKNLPTLVGSHQHGRPGRLVYNALMLAACIKDPHNFTPLLENLKSSPEVMSTSWLGIPTEDTLHTALENNQVTQ